MRSTNYFVGSPSTLFSSPARLFSRPLVLVWAIKLGLLIVLSPGLAHGQHSLKIVDPQLSDGETLVAPGAIDLTFRISNERVTKVRVKIEAEFDATSRTITIDPDKREHQVTVQLFKGRNSITLFGLSDGEPDRNLRDGLHVRCSGKSCGAEDQTTAGGKPKKGKDTNGDSSETSMGNGETKEPDAPGNGAAAKNNNDEKEGEKKKNEGKEVPLVEIKFPTNGAVYKNASMIDSNIVVKKESEIDRILVQVMNNNEPIPQGKSLSVDFQNGKVKLVTLAPKIRIGPGKNVVTVFDAAKPNNLKTVASVEVSCEGEKCGTEIDVSNIPTSSLNTRVVVGFEQAGASSATSETKPFLDLFFAAPFKNGSTNSIPRFSTWGQVRLSTTPEQTGAVGAFPSNLVNQVTQTNRTIDLVHSFDFLAGIEGRLWSPASYFTTLIPGVKQQTSIFVIAGGGAISPLSTKRESAQIFKVPEPANSQYNLFVERFGAAAAAKKYVGFVFPERDRFHRQWYGGLRFKTYYFNENSTKEPINRFPAILDVMLGQNEAVTGGKLKNDVTDANGKIIGSKRSYVFRIDGFYPLPFREARFLYLYGTAVMKIGGGGVKISTPLFLDTAPGEILVTNNDVFVAPNLQLDRDYYKIGVGINLTDLFNRKQPN